MTDLPTAGEGPARSGTPSARLGGQGLLAAAGLVAAVTLLARAAGLAPLMAV